MRTLGEILAALRDVLGQGKAAADSCRKADDDYHRGVLESLHEIKTEIKSGVADSEKHQRLQEKKFVWERIGIVVSAITMVAVIIYAYVAQQQLRTFQAAEGAVLNVELGNITDTGAQMFITNTGRRPSPEASLSAVVARFAIPNATGAPFYVNRPSLNSIAASIPATRDQVRFGGNIPIAFKPGERAQLEAGEHVIAISVRLVYDDGFGQTRQHVFCYHTSQSSPRGWKLCGGPITPSFLDGLRETP